MILLLSLLSIFIPFESTQETTYFPFAEYDFRLFCTRTPTVVALVVSDIKSPEDNKAIDRFSKVSPEFSENAYFLVLNRSQVPQLNSRFQYTKPYMVLINRAQLSLNCEIPDDDLSLVTTIHFWTTSLRYTAKSLDDLFQLLGPTKYAFILRDTDVNDAFRIVIDFISAYGTTEIVTATETVFEQLDMKSDKFLLFRRDDNSITPLTISKNLTDDDNKNQSLNYTELIANARKLGTPNYSLLDSQDLEYENFTFLGLIYENNFESNDKNFDASTVLENLHNIAPDFKVVLIQNEFFNAVESVTHQKIESTPDLIAFNYKMNFFYPNNGYFIDVAFGSDEWKNNAKKYVDLIRNGEIERKYHSEDENDKNQIHTNYINSIVGSNFQNFVDDPQNDVLVIFRKKNDKQSKLTSELSSNFGLDDNDFIQISEEIIKSSENDQIPLKIGIIDPTMNSSPKKFPFFIDLPHVELYPRQQKNHSKSLFGRVDRNSIIRFLKANNIDLKLTSENLTINEALIQMETIVSKFNKMPAELKLRAESYVSKVLQPIVDIDPFNSPFGMTPEEIVQMKKNARNSQWLDTSIDNLDTFVLDSPN